MGKLETMRTSSSRREVRPEKHRSTVGCMSGIFRLLSRNHNHSQKRLTSAKKEEKPAVATALMPPPPPVKLEQKNKRDEQPRRSSCETPRSPSIPQEIRLPAAVAAAPSTDYSPRRSSALVARLMGLEDEPAAALASAAKATPGNKRRELLRVLEKCDEDLKALRRIIDAVRTSESHAKTASSPAAFAAARSQSDGEDSTKESNGGEQPSPVSVLDAISSPRYRLKRSPDGTYNEPLSFTGYDEARRVASGTDAEKQGIPAVRSRIARPSRMDFLFAGDRGKSGACYEHVLSQYLLHHRSSAGAMPLRHEFKSRGREIVESFRSKVGEGVGGRCWIRKRRRSQAMAESVAEVWEDGVWEKRWEVGRVGVRLEGDILWDMVEELVVEFLGWNCKLSLLAGTCRKKLRF